MSEKNLKKIKPNTACQIIVESDFFLNKYGTSTPKIVIEDLASVVFDKKIFIMERYIPIIIILD